MTEDSGFFPLVRGLYRLITRRGLVSLVDKFLRLWRREGLRGVLRVLSKVRRDYQFASYQNWFLYFGKLKDSDRELIKKHIETFTQIPLISLLLPTDNATEAGLRRAIDSVRSQLYPYWELCICTDGPTSQNLRIMLETYVQLDGRIRIVPRYDKSDITAALNTAIDTATGEFVADLHQEDELAEHALYLIVQALENAPYLDLIYSDEDQFNIQGIHFSPYFKPDWNPDLLMSQNMLGHLSVYRVCQVRAVGGYRKGYEGAQAWDLALRVSERIPASHIHHLHYVLYHRFALTQPVNRVAGEDLDSLNASMAAVREHLTRIGCVATVNQTVDLNLRVQYELPHPRPLVSIIIPTRNGLHLLQRCIKSVVEKTTYESFEIIVVDNQSDDSDTLIFLESLKQNRIARVLSYDAPFNYSAINNYASKYANGELICLLNNDIEVIGSDWLGEMVSQAIRTEIGAVGALLYYPDDTIQHAGVIVGMSGCADHIYSGAMRGTEGMMHRACSVQNFSALTAACLVVRKSVFDGAGGFDELNLPVAFNDVDFCLRIMEQGYRNLWTPFAELYHHESATRGAENTQEKLSRLQGEISFMRFRWAHLMGYDPAFNLNLSLDNKWPRQGAEPRVDHPWLTRIS